MSKKCNRELIRVTSSNELQKQMCVDLRRYKSYWKQIWYSLQAPDCHYVDYTVNLMNLQVSNTCLLRTHLLALLSMFVHNFS